MCLESRAWWFRAAKVGFKVLEYDNENKTLVSYHYPSGVLPMNEWLNEEDFRIPSHQKTEWESGIYFNNGHYYPYGFHSFHRLEDALVWKHTLEHGNFSRLNDRYSLRVAIVRIEEPVAKGKQVACWNSVTEKEHKVRVTVSKRIKIIDLL